jgi:gliding motility-associated lipoprotein GldH
MKSFSHFRIYHLIILALAVSLTSCHSDIVYSRFYSIPSDKWHVDSVAQFDYTIDDTAASYNVLVYVRHSELYPYQNMWLFVGDSLQRDTIEFYLADDRGQWLGNKHHGFIEMPVLLEQNMHYVDTGTYHMILQHGMRDSLLRGVMDVGLEIVKQ